MLNTYKKLLVQMPYLEEKMRYFFKTKKYLEMACIHSSFVNESSPEVKEHNERLEFLGDAVLGLIISQYLYEKLPEQAEGVLSQLKARLVDAAMCARLAKKLGLSEYIVVGKGEKGNLGRGRDSLYADLFEALLGAIYLDGGLRAAQDFFWLHYTKEIEEYIQAPEKNWKAQVQEYFQAKYHQGPDYQVLGESGPEHSKRFLVGVFWKGELLGKGQGPSKKEAAQGAAEEAWKKIEDKHE